MKNESKFIALIGMILILLLVFGLNFAINIFYGNYSLIDRCNNYHIKILNVKEYRGVLFINDSLEFSSANRENNDSVLWLYKFIKLGDSLVLESTNDTLFIYRNKKKHWFKYYGRACGEEEPSGWRRLFEW